MEINPKEEIKETLNGLLIEEKRDIESVKSQERKKSVQLESKNKEVMSEIFEEPIIWEVNKDVPNSSSETEEVIEENRSSSSDTDNKSQGVRQEITYRTRRSLRGWRNKFSYFVFMKDPSILLEKDWSKKNQCLDIYKDFKSLIEFMDFKLKPIFNRLSFFKVINRYFKVWEDKGDDVSESFKTKFLKTVNYYIQESLQKLNGENLSGLKAKIKYVNLLIHFYSKSSDF